MILPKCIFLLLAVTNIASCQSNNDVVDNNSRPQMKRVVHEVNLNRAFDAALPNIRSYLNKNGFDPMDIPDVEIPLSHLPGLLKTKMILHHGHIQELSTIYRTGDIVLRYSQEKFELYLNIGWETLDLSHQYNLRYMLYNRKGDCYGRYHNVVASLLVEFDRTTKKIDLKFFKFADVGDFKLKLEGHFGDKLLNMLSSAITKIFRTQVLRQIEAKVYEEVDKTIQEINDMIPSPINF